MLNSVWCLCGYGTSIEVNDHQGYRWKCPDCRMGHVAIGSNEGNKSLDVFQTAIRRLVQQDAEGAATGFGQSYELWLKAIVRDRDRQWFESKSRLTYPELVAQIKTMYGLRHFKEIKKTFRNKLEHDLAQITNTAEAQAYGDHILETMRTNLTQLVGEDTWRRGEAGDLNSHSSTDSDEHLQEFCRYHDHYRNGTVGTVMWAQTWWSAYRSGRTDWHRAEWTGRPNREVGAMYAVVRDIFGIGP